MKNWKRLLEENNEKLFIKKRVLKYWIGTALGYNYISTVHAATCTKKDILSIFVRGVRIKKLLTEKETKLLEIFQKLPDKKKDALITVAKVLEE